MTAALPLIDGALFIDNTTLEKGTTCPRSLEYYLLHKRQSSSERAALHFGDVLHKALEARYRLSTAVTPAVTAAMQAAVSTGFEHYTPPEGDFRSFQFALDVIEAYNSEYPLDEFTVELHNGVPMIEVPFAFPLGEFEVNTDLPIRSPEGVVSVQHITSLPVIWTGRIDMLYRRNGLLYGMDHKTTTQLGPTFFPSFELAGQFQGYSWAIEQALGQLPHGFTINALALRKPTKSGKGLEFPRHTIYPTRETVDEWRRDVLHIVEQLLHNLTLGYFPKHTAWCFGKYGRCEYHTVCTLPQSEREMMLHGTGEYKDVTWNPLSERA